MLQLKAYTSNLPFQDPFTISKGTKTSQPALITSLGFGKLKGWGEAPAISYYQVTVAEMMDSLEHVRQSIERYSLTDPYRFWHFLHHLIPGQHFLTAALDIAGWDLFAQLRKQPLFEALGYPSPGKRICDYTIGLDTREIMLRKMLDHPFESYKIKLAAPSDIDLLRLLREHTKATFRLDINEGWNYEDTLRLIPELKKLGVFLLEQPLPKGQWEEMKALKAQTDILLFADEACVLPSDVPLCENCFHGINIKLVKCGGLTPAMEMIQKAKSLNLKVMLGSMNESSIGSAAVLQLAAKADFLDVDGPLLLAEDLATGLNYDSEGFVSLGPGNGLGIHVNL